MDDIVVKTKDTSTLIQDLEETFANLRMFNLKLNPEKCVFGIPSGKLLGFFILAWDRSQPRQDQGNSSDPSPENLHGCEASGWLHHCVEQVHFKICQARLAVL